MHEIRTVFPGCTAAAFLLATGWHSVATAENIVSIYTGTSFTRDSDLRIRQPGAGTGINISNVRWKACPFKPALYYGLRFTRFNERGPNWGVALDYTHYKMYARTEDIKSVSETGRARRLRAQCPSINSCSISSYHTA